jgi:hypothetical protein
MTPRRCSCGCYIADHLSRCPKCGKRAAPHVSKTLKATGTTDHSASLARLDRDAVVLNADKLLWMPSQLALDAYQQTLTHLYKRLHDLPERRKRMRSVLLSEIRHAKSIINTPRVKRWTTLVLHTKTKNAIFMYISPKDHRYVPALAHESADLILTRGAVRYRFRRFETSRYARLLKTEKQEAAAQHARVKAKKKRRLAKQKTKRSTP